MNKLFTWALIFFLPQIGFAQYRYTSKNAKFSISFPGQPYEKISLQGIETTYENEEEGVIYIVSIMPTNQQELSTDKLLSYVNKVLSKEKANEITSIELTTLKGRESVKVAIKADYEHYQLFYKIEYLIVKGHEVSIVIMSAEDKITFKSLDQFLSTLKWD